MNLTYWYAVSIAAATASLILHRLGRIASKYIVSRFKSLALQHIAYPLLIHRRYWGSVTRLQGALVGSYVAVNGFCMGLGIRSTSDLMARAGMMASINLVPLFLGGRTNMLANFLGISLHTYYLAHHWIGRVVVVQSLLHVSLVIASGGPWTFDSFQISGISAASALALSLLLSLYFIRKLMYEIFIVIHLFLALAVVIALLVHLGAARSTKSIFPVVSLSLWGTNQALRLSRMVYYSFGKRWKGKDQATITHFLQESTENAVSAMRITVRLPKETKVQPGDYYYLFLSGLGTPRRLQSHPHVVTWWDYASAAKTLSFLIQPRGGISSDLIGRKSIPRVILDGPYGKDLHLDNCETVILIARGIGIAGILPYARHMTDRRVLPDKNWAYEYRRDLITRKIDLYWVMEDNHEEEWVSDWVGQLRELDYKNLILTFTCFYPGEKRRPPPVPNDSHWRFIYQKDPLPIIEDLIVKQTQRSPGKTKVAVCGSSGFSNAIRGMVLRTMDEYRNVEFVETEFQPQGIRRAYPGIHTLDRDDIEMAVVKDRQLNSRRPGDPSRLKKSNLKNEVGDSGSFETDFDDGDKADVIEIV